MLPLGDSNIDRVRNPIVNTTIIIINVIVFIFLQRLGTDVNFTFAFSTVPAEIISGSDIITKDKWMTDPYSGERYIQPGLKKTPISVYTTLITSMFMHGSIAHIIGNMLFLFVFGDNIENRIGHSRYLIFYIVCGIVASLSHVFATYFLGQDPMIPSLGASGAISGVLGAYILLFPRNRVTVLMFNLITHVPAYIALGIWFLFQLISGLGMLGGSSYGGGVAYGAHIGGFIAGFVLIKFFEIGKQ